jgi:hypothetical protein
MANDSTDRNIDTGSDMGEETSTRRRLQDEDETI